MRRLLALLSIAHSCVSVDTGPAHAAAALNCPLTVLFGKADPRRTRPVSLHSKVIVISGEIEETSLYSDITSWSPEHDIGHITPEQAWLAWQRSFMS